MLISLKKWNCKNQYLNFFGILSYFIILIGIILGTKYSELTLISFILCSLNIVIDTKENNIYLLLMLLPFADIFKILSLSSISLFTIIEIFFLIKLIICSKNKDLNILLLFLVCACYIIIGTHDLIESFKLIINLLLLFYLLTDNIQLDFKKSIYCFSIAIIISSVVAMFFYDYFSLNLYIEKVFSFEDAGGLIERFSGLKTDPNYFSIGIIIAIFGLLIMMTTEKISFLKLILLFILIFFGIRTNSKSFFIMLIFCILFYFVNLVRKRKIILFVVSAAFISLIVILIINGSFTEFDTIFMRFKSSDALDSLTTNRSYFWKLYIDYIFSSPKTFILGDGALAELKYSTGPHNTYIDFIIYFGISGTFCILFFIFNVLRKQIKINLYSLAYYCIIFMMYFFLSGIFYYESIFHLFIGIIFYRIDNNKGELV